MDGDVSVFLAAAATVTKAVDFLRNAIDSGGVAPKWLWNIAAFVLGIVAAWVGDLNIMPDQSVGQVVTGLAIGAAASGFHEVFDFFSAKAKAVK